MPDADCFLPDLLARYAERCSTAPSGMLAVALLARVDGTAESWAREADLVLGSWSREADHTGAVSFVEAIARTQSKGARRDGAGP